MTTIIIVIALVILIVIIAFLSYAGWLAKQLMDYGED